MLHIPYYICAAVLRFILISTKVSKLCRFKHDNLTVLTL